jgi:hypothetical protein
VLPSWWGCAFGVPCARIRGEFELVQESPPSPRLVRGHCGRAVTEGLPSQGEVTPDPARTLHPPVRGDPDETTAPFAWLRLTPSSTGHDRAGCFLSCCLQKCNTVRSDFAQSVLRSGNSRYRQAVLRVYRPLNHSSVGSNLCHDPMQTERKVDSASREHFVDWLRVMATGIVLLFHCARFFDHEAWHVKNPVWSCCWF